MAFVIRADHIGDHVEGTDTDNYLSDGAEGNVELVGHDGNDTYYVFSDPYGGGIASVFENPDEGIDTVILRSYGGYLGPGDGYTLEDNVENLALDGSEGWVGGNDLDNNINASMAGYGYNFIHGYGGDDTLIGSDAGGSWGSDGDYMYGGDGNDALVGNGGQDHLFGGYGTDFLSGGDGDDDLEGGNDADTLLGGDGNDSMDGGEGNDTLSGGYGNDEMWGGGGNDSLDGGYGDDTLHGGDGDDTLYTGDQQDWDVDRLFGDFGNDTLTGGDGGEGTMSFLYGGDGDDVLNSGVHHYDFGGVYGDRLFGGEGNDTLNGSGGDDYLSGGYGNDTIKGFGGNDELHGGYGDDNLVAGGGDDELWGGYGTNTLNGGFGDDTYYLTHGSTNTISDAAGTDTVIVHNQDYDLSSSGDIIENLVLAGTGYGDGEFLGHSLSGNGLSNYILGSYGDDVLFGAGGNDTLDGGEGADLLVGAGGNDTYLVDDEGDMVVEETGLGTDTIISSVNLTLPDNVENGWLANDAYGAELIGNELDNELTGNMYNNLLMGGAGSDVLDGGEGSDLMFGGAGDDEYHVDNPGDVIIEEAGGGTDTVYSAVDYELGQFQENLVLTDGAEGATGNDLNNFISGNDYGNFIDGGAGDDVMAGGDGDDVYQVDSLGDSIVEGADAGFDVAAIRLDSGTFVLPFGVEAGILYGSADVQLNGTISDDILVGNDGDNFLRGFAGDDIIYGGAGNDIIKGHDGNDYLDGGSGNDNMAGRAGDDTYVVDRGDGDGGAINGANEDTVTEFSGEGNDTVLSSVYSYTLTANVENLVLDGDYAFKGFGNSLDNDLTGNSQDNTLIGFGGADYINGGGGNDTLDGRGASDEIHGGSGDDMLLGGGGDDLLDGGSGNDVMGGETGNDTYRVDSLSDVVAESAGQGTDTVETIANLGLYTLGDNVENLTLLAGGSGYGNALDNIITGSNGSNVLSGGPGGNDTLTGLAGDDDLYGGDGNDILDGGEGSDLLDGGTGDDTMTGGDGDDTFMVDSLSDTVNEGADGGYDTIVVDSDVLAANVVMAANVEEIDLNGYGNAGGIGNALDNLMYGSGGNNSLVGNGGNDDIFGGYGNDFLDGGNGNDVLVGGLGNDIMNGGAGDDFFVVQDGDGGAGGGAGSIEDRVAEATGGGNDTVALIRGEVSTYRVPDNVENVEAWGYGGGNFNGNFGVDSGYGGSLAVTLGALDNQISAAFANDFYGTDMFDGAGGTDTLFGQVLGNYGGEVDLLNIENINLDVDTDGGEGGGPFDWTIHTGNVAGQEINITGNGYGGASGTNLLLDEISNTAAISITGFYGDGSELGLNLDDAAGLTDSLTLNIDNLQETSLSSDGLETLNLEVAAYSDNSVDVSGIVPTGGDPLIHVTGGPYSSLEIYGLDTYGGSTVFAQHYHYGSLHMDTGGYGAAYGGTTTLEVDHSIMELSTDTDAAGIDNLTIDSMGDVPANTNGGSIILASGVGSDVEITLQGAQDLTLLELNNPDVLDARGLSGDLDAEWGSGGTLFYASNAANDLQTANGNDSLYFGAEGGAGVLGSDDHIMDDSAWGDSDYLYSTVNGGGMYTPDVTNIEYMYFSFGYDTDSVLDFSDVDMGSSTGPSVYLYAYGSYGGAPDVTVQGLNGDDFTIYDYTNGDALLQGGEGDDHLHGNNGDDTLNGGEGYDTLTGGSGADTFVFDNLGAGIDTIGDFYGAGLYGGGDGDVLELSLSIFGEIGSVGGSMDPSAFLAYGGTPTAGDANDHVLYDTASGALYYDPDGDGAESAIQFATLTGAPDLSDTDIMVTA